MKVPSTSVGRAGGYLLPHGGKGVPPIYPIGEGVPPIYPIGGGSTPYFMECIPLPNYGYHIPNGKVVPYTPLGKNRWYPLPHEVEYILPHGGGYPTPSGRIFFNHIVRVKEYPPYFSHYWEINEKIPHLPVPYVSAKIINVTY